MKIGITLRMEAEAYKRVAEEASPAGVEEWMLQRIFGGLSLGKKCACRPSEGRADRESFLAFFEALCEQSRTFAQAYRALIAQWMCHEVPIPGYEDWPEWPKLPYGWSSSTLSWKLCKYKNSQQKQPTQP